jgi:3-carboxy-cis,cis-muconate cycloisomerase
LTFDAIFVPDDLREAVSDRSWLAAMLDAERGLANAEALAGVLSAHAAAAIAEQCRAELFDVGELAEQGRAVANPAGPLVRALRERVGGEAASYVHWGATSQDIVDTAAMLVAQRALYLIVADLDGACAACASLAREHRSTPMAGRTLLQHAVPITFGLKAAAWLVGLVEARRGLVRVRDERLAAQLGGAAGTLAVLGDKAAEVLRLYADEVDLPEPVVPWHTERTRIAEIGAALAIAAGVAAKIGLDVSLLAQTEVAEVAEASGGGSSTMPQKQNPVGSAIARACALQAQALAGVLTGALAQEHERGAGGWQAEWGALSGALAATGGAVGAIRGVLEGLVVRPERMRANLHASGGPVVAERVSYLLTERLGREAAHDLVASAARAAVDSEGSFRDLLLDHPRTGFSADELDAALDPEAYLGAAADFVDRALEAYEGER